MAVRGAGRVLQIQGRHLEHLPRTLAVAGGDDGGVDIDEAPVLEEGVYGVGRHGPDPEHGGEQVGTGPQMGDGAQVLHAVALFLQGVVRGGHALHHNGAGLHLQRLFGLRREHHSSLYDQGRAHVLGRDLLIIIQHIGVHDHLQVPKAGAVVELNEPEGLHVTDGPGPAADGDGLPIQLLAVGVNGRNFDFFHMISPAFSKNWCIYSE